MAARTRSSQPVRAAWRPVSQLGPYLTQPQSLRPRLHIIKGRLL